MKRLREAMLEYLLRSDGEFVSGALLARQLGVSRTAVWKAVRELSEQGYNIESVTAKGYRLSSDNNRLSGEIISAILARDGLCREIISLDETESTNDYAKSLAVSGASHGTVVVADRQTSGKGRTGRNFVSPQGTGVYISVIIRPDFPLEYTQLITSASACAVASAIDSLCGCSCGIKWVNDIYINSKKICGILTEGSVNLETNSLEFAVVGVGINVRSVKKIFSEELLTRASSIYDELGFCPDRNILCAEFIKSLDFYLQKIRTKDFLEEYRQREILTGNPITAVSGNRCISGEAVGIDDNANILIKTQSGEIIALNSGEASVRKL